MAEFRYTYFFSEWTIRVGSDGIYYGHGENLKYIPRSDILGVAIAYSMIEKNVGFAKKIGNKIPYQVNKDPDANKLEKGQAMLVIKHGNIGEKEKVTRIPLNMKDQMCLAMINQAQKEFRDIYVGAGPQQVIDQALKISHTKLVLISTVLVLLLIFGSLILTFLREPIQPPI